MRKFILAIILIFIFVSCVKEKKEDYYPTTDNDTVVFVDDSNSFVENETKIDDLNQLDNDMLDSDLITEQDSSDTDFFSETCGNRKVESPEVCDSTTIDCKALDAKKYKAGSAKCKDDCSGYDVSGCVLVPQTCGNGKIEGNEVCDDGNTKDGDYCSSDCKHIIGKCGDEIVQTNEKCDDGNNVDGDYCSGDCKKIIGYCGDGKKQDNEACDDGNTKDNDYCSKDCKHILGRCGDGKVQTNEECDDGNNKTEHCTSTAGEIVCGENCKKTTCINDKCGNGVKDPGEECDDGNTITDDCDYGEQNCTVCTSNCTFGPGNPSFCGDGKIDKANGEVCDDGNSQNGDYCNSTCTQITGKCGDGIEQTNEACDDGNNVDGDYCSGDCSSKLGYCGDGKVQVNETCDKTQSKSCSEIDPKYVSGNAQCKNDCSDWDLSECNESGGCVDVDNPDDSPNASGEFVDSNCDGIDGNIDDSIFVDSINGNNSNPGTNVSPVQSIQTGIMLAVSNGKHTVLVANGTYYESLYLKSGISVHGGYSGYPNWTRSDEKGVIVIGGTKAVIADNVSNVHLTYMQINSQDNTEPSGSSFGVILNNCSNFHFSHVDISAGNGGNGVDGNNGVAGADGNDGGKGQPGNEDSNVVGCSSGHKPDYGKGGASTCGAFGGNGGFPGLDAANGQPGDNGAGSVDNGGKGGTAEMSGSTCDCQPGSETNGKNGQEGSAGINGEGGNSFGNFDLTNYYIPANGQNGTNGQNGQGGGGGGGGHGGNSYCRSWGSSGGGGGAGGCGGTGGTAGKGGGGSFGIFIINSSDINFTKIKINTGNGGKGGDGGRFGKGGKYGLGGKCGEYGGSGSQDDAGCGGCGGNGGMGGNGGNGGGGGGGPSIGIFKHNSTVSGELMISFKVGLGGHGGDSEGNAGKEGLSKGVFSK